MNLELNATKTFRILIYGIGFLLALHLFGLFLRGIFGKEAVESIIRIVNFADERNLPTLFTVLVMILNSLGCLFVSRQNHPSVDPMRWGWIGLGLIFAFLAIDEFASIHEQISRKLEIAFGLTGPFLWTWVIPYSVLVLAVALLFARFLRRLPRATASRFIAAGVVYVTGALVLEMVEGAVWSAEHRDFTIPIMLTLVTVEETLEMLGMVLFFRGLLIHFRENIAEFVTVRI